MSEPIPPSPDQPLDRRLLCCAAAMVALNVVVVVGILRSEVDPDIASEATDVAHSLGPSPTVPTSEPRTDVSTNDSSAAAASSADDSHVTGDADPSQPVDDVPVAKPKEIAESPAAEVPAGRRRSPIARPYSRRTAAELLADLSDVEELDVYSSRFDAESSFARLRYRRMRAEIFNAMTRPDVFSLSNPLEGPRWQGTRLDLDGIPMLDGDACQLSDDEGRRLATVSKEVGTVAVRASSSGDRNAWNLVDTLVDATDHYDPSGLHQILQIAPVPTRRVLVTKLAEDPSTQATKALVQRTLYDFDAGVRRDAADALESRAATGYTDELLAAFDHPWPPVAEHAADAIVSMGRIDLAERLRKLANEPDPRTPRVDEDGHWFTRELVRVNHLRNCLLCHAPHPVPSGNRFAANLRSKRNGVAAPDPIYGPEGVVPDPYAPLPSVYYENRERNKELVFVRADITYVWQDFSVVMEATNRESGWPAEQRFDFLVRKRRLTEDEADQMLVDLENASSPQRLAARYALSRLERSASR